MLHATCYILHSTFYTLDFQHPSHCSRSAPGQSTEAQRDSSIYTHDQMSVRLTPQTHHSTERRGSMNFQLSTFNF
jgi:hypothetical protein